MMTEIKSANVITHIDPDGFKTILINPIYAKDKPSVRTLEEKMKDVGANTGNLMFAEGIKDNLIVEREGWLSSETFSGVKRPVCIIPSANFIIHGGDTFIKELQRFLDQTDCPLTLAGLGAQSSKELNTPQKLISVLNTNTKKCFQRLAERAVSLGIRGEFTAECLELMGIYNYRIIGCPSVYHFSPLQNIPLKNPSLEKCQITVTTGNMYESKIIEMGYQLDAEWVMQMATEMPECISQGILASHVWINKRFPGIKLSTREVNQYMKKKGHIFFTLEAWNQFYEKNEITFSFGSRFHGNIAALRNGVPALWITHDSRTAELVKSLHLPHITQETFSEVQSPQQLIEYISYTDFFKNYPNLFKNYIEYLTENHINFQYKV